MLLQTSSIAMRMGIDLQERKNVKTRLIIITVEFAEFLENIFLSVFASMTFCRSHA